MKNVCKRELESTPIDGTCVKNKVQKKEILITSIFSCCNNALNSIPHNPDF